MKSENNEDNRNAESRTVSSAGGARRQVPRQKNAGSRTRQYRGGKNRQDKPFRPSVKKTAAGGAVKNSSRNHPDGKTAADHPQNLRSYHLAVWNRSE
mgnify:CR=1 FL=1